MRPTIHVLVLSALIPMLAIGCATNSTARWRETVPQRNAGNLPGPFGVALVNGDPQIAVKPGDGKAAGAGKGSLNAMGGAASAMNGIGDSPLALFIVVPVLVGSAIGGAIYGGSKSPSKKSQIEAAQQIIEGIQRADVPQKILASLRAETAAYLGTNLVPVDLSANASDRSSLYLQRNLPTVLEIDSLKIGLTEDGARENEARLFLEAHSSLRDVANGKTIHELWWRYLGDSRGYALVGGAVASDECNKLTRQFAEDLSEEIFLKALPETSGQFYGLAPIAPKPKPASSTLWNGIPFVPADSRQPTLKWSPYAPSAELGEISNVSYELKIWSVPAGFSPSLLYHKQNLFEAEHHVAQLLSPESNYYWTVRAHFLRNGRPAVSSWGQIKTSNSAERWPGPIRFDLLYRFKTPKI
jgi:hypothetical protein